MRALAVTTICLALLMSALPAKAQDGGAWQAETPRFHGESVMTALMEGDAQRGFKILFSKGHYSQSSMEKVQFDYFQLVKQQGPPLGYELILARRAGRSLMRLQYVVLFKTVPYLFDLYYYHATDGWALKSFTVSRDIKQIFRN
ncbi:hypothetical protein [Pseudodesulfovibrio sp.]|uniref:hypothetical protein n=1 Tax=unclassified Pseudodesulfovibrio TaxID=2661612 RepID=UPI003B004A3D